MKEVFRKNVFYTTGALEDFNLAKLGELKRLPLSFLTLGVMNER